LWIEKPKGQVSVPSREITRFRKRPTSGEMESRDQGEHTRLTEWKLIHVILVSMPEIDTR
jgi:hypothetical protein